MEPAAKAAKSRWRSWFIRLLPFSLRLNFAVTLESLEHLIAFLGIEQNGSPNDDRGQNSFADPVSDLSGVHLFGLRIRDHSSCLFSHSVIEALQEHYVEDKI